MKSDTDHLRAGVSTPTVFVVDDDPSVRKSLRRLLTACGYRTRTYGSAQDYLADDHETGTACLVLDVRLPDLSGLDLQKALAEQGSEFPIVFITGHGDIPMSVRAMKSGAIDFLAKPFSEEALLAAIEQALDEHRRRMSQQAELASVRQKLLSLSPRERQVLKHVVAGRLNKQISADLGIAMRTVKMHRASIMEKLQVRTVPDLVRMAERVPRLLDQEGAPGRSTPA